MTTPKHRLGAILTASATGLLLGACVAGAQSGGGGPVRAPMPGGGACNAGAVQSYVGREATQQALAEIRAVSGARAMRVAGPDMAVTMDFSEDRLTIEVDRANRILRLACN